VIDPWIHNESAISTRSALAIQARLGLRTRRVSTATLSLVERSARLAIDAIDFQAFVDRPLDPESLRCLRYMCDVESHTVCYLREVLATRVHQDPEITAFLAAWSYEEYWHGEALSRVLQAHGLPSAQDQASQIRRSRRAKDLVRLLLFTLGSAALPDLPAVHMAWGALNEMTTQAGYARLAAKAQHPQLTELLRRIMRQEGRHIDFYSAQARARLAASAGARRLTRFALRRFWAPVGSGVMPEGEVRFLARFLFGDAAGKETARRIDRQLGRLPGLEGLRLVEPLVAA
jgi:rubrerythrin